MMRRGTKRILIASVVALSASSAMAGGLGEPVMEPEVVAEKAASSGGIVIPLLLLILVAAALSGGDGGGSTPVNI